ncbi:prolipoprotein diacylglyceryl transferase [Myxococcota bacterium]|nr:prolipoprotein diacylglyceryl transferase [Myxococcota bacterium]
MLVWNFDPQIVSFLPIRWYGVLFAAMLMVGFQFWRWQVLRAGRKEAEAEAFLMAAVIAVIGGARLGHCLFYEPEKYLRHPIEILKVWEGGLASHGATIGLLLAMFWWGRKHAMAFIEVLDRFSFAACAGVIFVRVANFTNSEIVGRVTDPESAPFAVKFVRSVEDRALAHLASGDFSRVPWRHPAQLYEAALGLFVVAVLYLVDRRLGESRRRGLLGFLFLTLYFGGRCVTEFYKEFQTLTPEQSPFTMGQYLSAPFALAGLFGLISVLRRPSSTSGGTPGSVG